MLIFSIVQTVQPGTICSHKPGRREVAHVGETHPRLDEATHEHARHEAQDMAELYNRHAYPGIRYSVEELDEESPDRAPPV